MGLKAGLQILQKAGKVATGYTDDIVGIGVRKWTKPTSLEGLRYVHNITEDSLNLGTEQIEKLLKSSNLDEFINPKFFIGQGGEGAVYRIADTNFVLKVPHKTLKTLDMQQNELRLNFDITPQDKINNIVAYFGDIKIMKYIEGVTTSDLQNREVLIKVIDSLSPNEIKNYFLKLANANRMGMMHDFCGANTIINLRTGKITPIDFREGCDTRLLNSFIAQFNIKELSPEQQNLLLKKGLTNLLELVKKGAISDKEISIGKNVFLGYGWGNFKDRKFLKSIIDFCEDYNKDKNIDKLLKNIKEKSSRYDIDTNKAIQTQNVIKKSKAFFEEIEI